MNDTTVDNSTTQWVNILRTARYRVLSDAEDWLEIVRALEFVGRVIGDENAKKSHGLGKLKKPLVNQIKKYFETIDENKIDEARQELQTIINLRNDAIHVGSSARNLANLCVSFCEKLEESMMGNMEIITTRISLNPVFVRESDPVVLARKIMLINSFTYLPVQCGDEWKYLSDIMIAEYKIKNKNSMYDSITTAFSNNLNKIETASESDSVESVLNKLKKGIVLVLKNNNPIGVITAFDIL